MLKWPAFADRTLEVGEFQGLQVCSKQKKVFRLNFKEITDVDKLLAGKKSRCFADMLLQSAACHVTQVSLNRKDVMELHCSF